MEENVNELTKWKEEQKIPKVKIASEKKDIPNHLSPVHKTPKRFVWPQDEMQWKSRRRLSKFLHNHSPV